MWILKFFAGPRGRFMNGLTLTAFQFSWVTIATVVLSELEGSGSQDSTKYLWRKTLIVEDFCQLFLIISWGTHNNHCAKFWWRCGLYLMLLASSPFQTEYEPACRWPSDSGEWLSLWEKELNQNCYLLLLFLSSAPATHAPLIFNRVCGYFWTSTCSSE